MNVEIIIGIIDFIIIGNFNLILIKVINIFRDINILFFVCNEFEIKI